MPSLPVTPIIARASRSSAWLSFVLLITAACSKTPEGSSLQFSQETLGDTTVVLNVAGSIWGDSVELIEELRIGRGEQDGAYSFGELRAIAVGEGEAIYVYDGSSKELRMFDSVGRFVRAIGRTGSGPGEYRDVIDLAIHRNGDLLVRDPALQRIHRYSPTGTLIASWRLASGLYDANTLTVDTAGRVYATILTGPISPNAPWPMGTARFDSAGTLLDTVPAPRWPAALSNPGPYDPEELWTWNPHGYLVTAFGANFGVELRYANGSITRIERDGLRPIPVPEAEREELTGILKARHQEDGEAGERSPSDVPREKPFLRALAAGVDGRIWVRVSGVSIATGVGIDSSVTPARRPRRWTENVAWDVFEEDGRYLGRVALPPRAQVHVMRGDRVWGVVRDDDDVPSIVRWRISTGRPRQ